MKFSASKWLAQGSFLRSVGVLSGGTLFAHGIVMAAMPLLARLYTPSEFGLLAVYAAIVSITSVVVSLRYNVAIPLPHSDNDGFALLAISLGFAALFSVVFALVIFIAPKAVAAWIGQPDLERILWTLPLGIFLTASYDALQNWALRMRRFWTVMFTRVTRATGGTGIQLGFGLASISPFGLIFGHMLFGGFGLLGLGRDLLHRDQRLLREFRLRRCLDCAREHYRFPVFSVPEALMNTMSVEVPIILIATMTVSEEAGFIMLATRVMGLPMSLIGGSVAQAYLSEARHKLADRTLFSFTRSTMRALCMTGAIPVVSAAILSPLIFPLLFGHQWARSGYIAAWMAPWFFLQFVASPVSMILNIMGKQLLAAYLQATGLVIRIGAVWIAVNHFPDWTGEVFALSGAAFYLLYIWIILTLLRDR